MKHLFGSTDDLTFADIRERVPRSWESLSDYLDWASDGVNAYEHLKGIDVLPQRGHVLIDGNHLFLHALRIAHIGIDTWNRFAKHSTSDSISIVPVGSQCPYSPITARLLSYIAGQLIHRSIDLSTSDIAKELVSSDTRLISTDYLGFSDPDWVVKNIDVTNHVVLENDWEIIVCDAPQPDQEFVLGRLLRAKERSQQTPNYLDWLINTVQQGQFI